MHRVSYIALAFQGREDDCCKALASWLRVCVKREVFLDASEPLFIRTWFLFNEDDDSKTTGVYGRLAFWDTKKNRYLMAQDCFKAEGAASREVIFPDLIVMLLT